MKGISKYFAGMAVVTAGLLSSCGMESQFSEEGEGLLFISPQVKGDVPSSTRADASDTPSDPKENFTIWIIGEKGVMKRFKGVDNIPESFSLRVGSYKADAWAGDSVSASFDKKFYRAFYQDFQINKGVNQLSVVCKIANVVVCFNPESLKVSLKDMKITVSNSKGSLVFDSQNIATASGYFMMPSMDETYLNYKIEGTTTDGTAYVKEGKIEGVQRAHKYTISLTEGEPLPTQGGALIKISIDETPIIEENINVFPAPAPRGLEFDIKEQVVSETRDFMDTKVYMRGYHRLQSVSVKFSDNFNIKPSQMDLLNNSAITQLGNRGISVEQQVVLEELDEGSVEVGEVYVTFTKNFLDALPVSPEEFKVTFEALDGDGQIGTGEVCFANSKEAVRFLPPVVPASPPDPATDPMAIGARKATLTGIIQDAEKATNYGIEYRKVGTTDWTKAYPSRTSMTRVDQLPFTVTITGLDPSTVYEYRAFCDDFVSTQTQQFSTEAIFQIPNASFEEWSTYRANVMLAGDTDVVLPSNTGDKETSFWGSGNEGGASASKVLTDKSSDMLHSGNYSVQLKSQSAMGIIAAGNLFVGKYVETDGTNGVLSLGRAYNGSHPSKVRVYANYRPGDGVKIKSGNEEFVDLTKDGKDHGQIYVALTTELVEIRTNPKKRKLFAPNDPCVVAYGQVTWTDNFGADGSLEQLDIPFEYNERAKTTQPKYLIIVASASKFGDYFCGSDKSVMYLDDFELIYE